MTNALIALAAIVALFLAVLVLRMAWRAFIGVLNREIDAEADNLRRQGFLGGDPHSRGRR